VTPRLPFGRAPVDEEVNAELAFHLEMATRELMERGMTRSQARAEAERRFGDLQSVNAECRRYGTERDHKARRAEYLQELRHDVAFTVRQLGRARGFAAVAIITLALGVGATAGVFSALDAVVLRPLPFDHPERIVEVKSTSRGESELLSAPEFVAMNRSGIFEHVTAAVLDGGMTLTSGDLPEIISAARVTSEYFSVFGEQPMLGRTFTAEEDQPGGPTVVVISHRLWKARFNGDRGIVGRTLQLEGLPYTVIGVMPASFDFMRGTEDMWAPLAFTPERLANYNARFFRAFARLRPNASLAQSQAAAGVAERVFAERIPTRTIPASEYGARLSPFVDQLIGDFRKLFATLLGAVGFVLLIACSNVANLLLGRGAARAKELAIRAALGAGRTRLIRQLLTESLVLAFVGALTGLGVAYGLQRLILAIAPDDIPRLEQIAIDWRVLAFTLLLGVICCLLFGLVPALTAAGPRMQGAMREGGRQTTVSRDRMRGLLVAAEVALAITLLVGSGLLIRSAVLMQRVNPGFDADGVLTARILLPQSRYSTPEAITRFYGTLRGEAERTPGMRSAALVSMVPMSNNLMQSSILGEGQAKAGVRTQANLRIASNGYFSTMGIPFVAGRDLSAHDDASAPLVVVVTEALAQKLWPGVPPRDVLGKRIDAVSDRPEAPNMRTIVGIVKDVHEAALDRPARPEFFVPVDQTPPKLWAFMGRSLVLVARAANASEDVESLVKPMRRLVARLDPSLPLADSRTMKSYLKGSLERARMNTLLLSLLGGIALVLAMVGTYGVVSYFVSQRTQEIGIRMALGATPTLVWQFVMRRGLTPIIVGLAVGLGLSSLTTTVLKGQLFGVTGHDPLTLAGVAVLLLAVGLAASYVPARRAMRVPPVVALNEG
jgi:putative ABC transport system permease protein